jgi:DNA-binding beta-propeller fold protein YncE
MLEARKKRNREGFCMQLNNKKTMVVLTVLIVLGSITMSAAAAAVEWEVQKTLQLKSEPIDVAVSPDGRRIFVLDDLGQILIYSSAGSFLDKIDVGNQFDHIKVSPRGDRLILNSRKKKSIQVITLDFIQNINVSGSPFKGSQDAPVVIAVFDDFE